jgi:ABC-2 type transport system permease protein
MLSIARTNLRRTLRERTNLFFVFVFPMLLILVLGVAFGGEFTPRVGVVTGDAGPLARGLLERLRTAEGITVSVVGSREELTSAVERGELEAGLVIPGDYDRTVRGGGTVRLRYVVRPGQQGQQVGSIVSSVVDEETGLLRAARFVERESGVSFDDGRRRAGAAAPRVALATVSVSTAGAAESAAPTGRFDDGASSQLLLFLFITALTGSAALIESRRLGVSRRMLSTPTQTWQIIAGEGLGRFSIAAVQAAVIMVGSALVFGVDWGDPLGAVALTVAFGLVATGAGLLMGAVARSTEQATAVGLLAGLGLAALGGTMMPLEFFSPTMRTVAHATPHAWAVDGFTELVRHGGGLTDIVRPLGVLLGTAAVLLALASWRLRRSITG